jgi:Helix-turn-helix domain
MERKRPNDRLREARLAKGFKTAAAAARAFGWNAVTYTSHENGNRNIRWSEAARYASAFGVTPTLILGGTSSAMCDKPGIPLVGEAAVGTWLDESIESMSPFPMRFTPAIKGPLHSLLVADRSVTFSIAKGEFAIFKPANLSTLSTGWLVVVSRKRGNLRELSVRKIEAINGARITLACDSPDDKFRRILLTVPPRKGDPETIEIVGVVVGKYITFLEETK